jgi:hypothetical protein
MTGSSRDEEQCPEARHTGRALTGMPRRNLLRSVTASGSISPAHSSHSYEEEIAERRTLSFATLNH